MISNNCIFRDSFWIFNIEINLKWLYCSELEDSTWRFNLIVHIATTSCSVYSQITVGFATLPKAVLSTGWILYAYFHKHYILLHFFVYIAIKNCKINEILYQILMYMFISASVWSCNMEYQKFDKSLLLKVSCGVKCL